MGDAQVEFLSCRAAHILGSIVACLGTCRQPANPARRFRTSRRAELGVCQTPVVPDYASFARNDYSQNGEDGIIEALLDQLPERNRWCVEFGAWDGEHLSNCANLIRNHDYSAVLIEASPERFRDLQATWQQHSRVTRLNAFVGFRPDMIPSTSYSPARPSRMTRTSFQSTSTATTTTSGPRPRSCDRRSFASSSIQQSRTQSSLCRPPARWSTRETA